MKLCRIYECPCGEKEVFRRRFGTVCPCKKPFTATVYLLRGESRFYCSVACARHRFKVLNRREGAYLKTQRYKGVNVVSKADSWLMRLIARLLAIVSPTSSNEFMSSFWTTPSTKTVYAPTSVNLDDDNALTIHANDLDHEMTHVGQMDQHGQLIYWFLYWLGGLPVGLAYFRYRFEREAYLVQIRRSRDPVTATAWAAKLLASSAYGWAWPETWSKRWFAQQLSQETAKNGQ